MTHSTLLRRHLVLEPASVLDSDLLHDVQNRLLVALNGRRSLVAREDHRIKERGDSLKQRRLCSLVTVSPLFCVGAVFPYAGVVCAPCRCHRLLDICDASGS